MGCFLRFGVGILKRIQGKLNSEAYQTKIVNDINIVGNCVVFHLCRFILQHDNGSCHWSASTLSFLTERHIDVSWCQSDRKLVAFHKDEINDLGLMNVKPVSSQMWKEIQNIWYNIPSSLCRRLVDFMTRRVSSIIKMKGYPTKY